MISKIIQKEKERQEHWVSKSPQTYKWCNYCRAHKQSLINLKEYIEQVKEDLWKIYNYYDTFGDLKNASIIFDKMEQLKEDIKELNLMIEKYE